MSDRIALASFPRSGNTFLRLVLYDCFGLKSWSVDGKEHFLELSAPTSLMEMQSKDAMFVKTHKLPSEHEQPFNKAIFVVRDPREALNSMAHYAPLASQLIKDGREPMTEEEWKAKYLVSQAKRWQAMLDGWEQLETVALVKFEPLIFEPIHMVGEALKAIGVEAEWNENKPPTFETLNASSKKFFRSGETDSWKRDFSCGEVLAIEGACLEGLMNLGYLSVMTGEIEVKSEK